MRKPCGAISVVEALWWAVSADEELGRADRKAYRKRRDVDNDGRVFEAVGYVRNRCGHQRALACEDLGLRLDTETLDDRAAQLGPAIRWRETAELPPPDMGYDDVELLERYGRDLAGRLVGETLAHVSAWFEKERR